jgi:hypothetical protein
MRPTYPTKITQSISPCPAPPARLFGEHVRQLFLDVEAVPYGDKRNLGAEDLTKVDQGLDSERVKWPPVIAPIAWITDPVQVCAADSSAVEELAACSPHVT